MWAFLGQKSLSFRYKYLGVLIFFFYLFLNFKIILKERQERLQQRLQESAVSLAVASEDAQKAENGASDQAAKQLHPAGTSFCVCIRIVLQVGAPMRMVICGRNCDAASLTWALW